MIVAPVAAGEGREAHLSTETNVRSVDHATYHQAVSVVLACARVIGGGRVDGIAADLRAAGRGWRAEKGSLPDVSRRGRARLARSSQPRAGRGAGGCVWQGRRVRCHHLEGL